MGSIVARHIQDHGEANTTTVKYWGYAERILPCTKDIGTCEYLDAVYTMHDESMLYSFILSGAILGVLAVWAALRIRSIGVASQGRGGLVDDICSLVIRLKKTLLPDVPTRWLFQHFYLTFPSLSIWQAHPDTVSSVSEPNATTQTHDYLIRFRDGQTNEMAAMGDCTLPVIIAGPHGHGFPSYETQHVLAVAGGTGVTFTYPIIMEFVRQSMSRIAVLDFVRVVRKSEDRLWLAQELQLMKGFLKEMLGLTITIFVSRESRVIMRRVRVLEPWE